MGVLGVTVGRERGGESLARALVAQSLTSSSSSSGSLSLPKTAPNTPKSTQADENEGVVAGDDDDEVAL